jgi:hypothetical protein
MNNYIKTDREGLVRDPKSGAILNTNKDQLESYRKQKLAFSQQEQFRQSVEVRIGKIENTLTDITQSLNKLAELLGSKK